MFSYTYVHDRCDDTDRLDRLPAVIQLTDLSRSSSIFLLYSVRAGIGSGYLPGVHNNIFNIQLSDLIHIVKIMVLESRALFSSKASRGYVGLMHFTCFPEMFTCVYQKCAHCI